MCPETVGNTNDDTRPVHPILAKQQEDVAKMRTSLLACTDNPETAVKSIQQITVLRVYHQVARIVRYLEMMDKIEDKLYGAIDHTLETMPTNSTATMMMLLNLQERLQKNIIDSHKLLQPYISIEDSAALMQPITDSAQSIDNSVDSLIPKVSRDRIRTAAQGILQTLKQQQGVIESTAVVHEDGDADVR